MDSTITNRFYGVTAVNCDDDCVAFCSFAAVVITINVALGSFVCTVCVVLLQVERLVKLVVFQFSTCAARLTSCNDIASYFYGSTRARNFLYS